MNYNVIKNYVITQLLMTDANLSQNVHNRKFRGQNCSGFQLGTSRKVETKCLVNNVGSSRKVMYLLWLRSYHKFTNAKENVYENHDVKIASNLNLDSYNNDPIFIYVDFFVF